MRTPPDSPPAGEVLRAVLRAAARAVEETEPAALADEPDGVHQHRVRVRRLRSVLAGFRDWTDPRAAERLRVAYAEWGRELGVVRDIEVRAQVAEAALERAGVDDRRVFARLVEPEHVAYAGAHARLVELAHGPRAVERTRMLRAFADETVAHDARKDAAPRLAAVLKAQARRVRKAAGRLDGSPESYHELRKAARRMRYVAEAIADAAPELFARQVAELAEAGDALHDALGGHRDAVLFAEHIAREGVLAARAGEPADVYSRIEADARHDAAQHLHALPVALKRLKAAEADLR